jgi:hypothetical protein
VLDLARTQFALDVLRVHQEIARDLSAYIPDAHVQVEAPLRKPIDFDR